MNSNVSKSLAATGFVVGFGMFVHVHIGVRLSVTEILLPLLLLANIQYWPKIQQSPNLRRLLIAGAVYCGAIVISDTLNNVPLFDFAKGIAVPLLISAYLILFSLLIAQSSSVILWIMYGLTAGSFVHLIYNTGADDFDFSTDSGYTFFVFRVTPLLFSAASLLAYYGWKVHRLIPLFVFFILGAVILRYGSRSYASTSLIAGALMWLTITPSRTKMLIALRPFKYWGRLSILACVLGFLASSLYVFLAGHGYLGSVSQQRFESQGGDKGFINLLMRGRSEALGVAQMIYDKPLFGHGSSSLRSQYFADAAKSVGNRYYARDIQSRWRHVRTNWGHSIVLGAWANAGVAAIVFWILALSIVCRLTVVLLVTCDRTICLLLIFIMSFAWDAIYSPLTVQMRALIPMLLAIGVVLIPKIQARIQSTLQVGRTSQNPSHFHN